MAPRLVAPAPRSVPPTAPLTSTDQAVVLRGVTALARRAQELEPGPALAALRTIGKQLDREGCAALSLDALAPLAATLARLQGAGGRAAAEAARAAEGLAAALDRAGHPLGGDALRGPGRAAAAAVSGDPAARALLAEALGANPHPREALAILGRAPDLAATLSKAARMYPPAVTTPAERAAQVARLEADLAVGDVGASLRAQMARVGLPASDVDTFFAAFAEVRAGFERGAQGGDDMQRVNWMHTRIEILHTLESAQALGLDARTPEGRRGVLAALYGALFSDALKDKGTFSLLWHNRAGAELLAPRVMGRVMDLRAPDAAALLAWTMRVAHEHQVTPPLFMAGPMKGLLAGEVAKAPEGPARLQAQAAADEVVQAVSKPLAAPQVAGEIVFSAPARALLEQAGLSGWAVPHDASWRAASMAAIAGDVWQYVSPEGVIKIAVDLRDPGSPAGPFMRDPVISLGWLDRVRPAAAEAARAAGQGGAIESSVGFSFGQGTSVIDAGPLRAALDGHQAAMRARLDEEVLPAVEARLRAALGVPAGRPTPAIPYWNAPLPTDGQLDAAQRASADLVKQTFQAVMAERGQVPLDPFGARASGGA